MNAAEPKLRMGGGAAELRPPGEVMRLSRLGSFFPTRLSFMQSLIRRMNREGWRFSRPLFELDGEGYGRAVYRVELAGRCYSLVAFSQALPDEARSDRVIAEAWDATFALYDGEPDPAALERLAANVPLQEAGRFQPQELVLSRANKSMRVFNHVAERLASGQQPDGALLAQVGYLMRTTAVYGNGKFGIADRARVERRPELKGPFQAEMLTVYLIRCFTLDLVEHVARSRNPSGFVPLDPALKRFLGVGNSTGLGMAPFLITHPELIHNWIAARETALARVCGLTSASPEQRRFFCSLIERAGLHAGQWIVADARQAGRIAALRDDLARLLSLAQDEAPWSSPQPWDALFQAGRDFSLEGQEMLVSLLLEPHGALVDALTETMDAPSPSALDPTMTVAALIRTLEEVYDWALALDFTKAGEQSLFWYVSEEKQEPRLGKRYEEAGVELEMPLGIAREMQGLWRALKEEDAGERLAAFLLRRPEFRHSVRRVQAVCRHPYGEIRDNLLAESCLPIDLLRCKLSFFGAAKFDPKSDRWTRITLYQGAPLPGDLGSPEAEDWCWPVMELASGTDSEAVRCDSP